MPRITLAITLAIAIAIAIAIGLTIAAVLLLGISQAPVAIIPVGARG